MAGRRDFLKAAVGAGAAGLAWPAPARALPGLGDPSRLVFAQARHGGRWDPRPAALQRLAWEVAKRTSIEVAPEPRAISLADPDLYRYPFLVLAAEGEVPPLSEAEVSNLRRYLTYGGFLLCDDASATPGGPFDRSVRRELARALPSSPLQRVPREHVLYKSFFLLDGPSGRTAAAPYLEAVDLQGRLSVVLSLNDLQGAWARDSFGAWEFDVVPGGESQRERAFRLGINIAMYALCVDYKDDQVHIPFIMKRRR
jgi:hypothetical protein